MGPIRPNPPSQYATDANLRARQRLWALQADDFDFFGWVLDVAGVAEGFAGRVLDVGCGPGNYLDRLRSIGVACVGLDLSLGMLSSVDPVHARVNGDAQRLPIASDSIDVVLAPHMLYHVPDRAATARELRRVLRPDGVCVAVTNGARHARSLRDLVEAAASVANPGWEMRNPSTHEFSLENGPAQLADAFGSVEVVRPPARPPARVEDPDVVAGYVASVADHYGPEVDRPWSEIVAAVRAAVAQVIDDQGAFEVAGDFGAIVCR